MPPLHIFLLLTFVFICFMLIASVLLQTGKGGGMAGLGGGSADTAFGAHTANVLQKFTMYCVIAFFALVIVLAHTSRRQENNQSVYDNFVAPEKAQETPAPTALETTAVPMPDAAATPSLETPVVPENLATETPVMPEIATPKMATPAPVDAAAPPAPSVELAAPVTEEPSSTTLPAPAN